MKKLITILSSIGLTATSASLVIACGSDVETNRVIIGPTSTLNQVEVGQTISVDVFLNDTTAVLTAVSSDTSIATVAVDAHKLSVTGVKLGTVNITLSAPEADDVVITVVIIAASA